MAEGGRRISSADVEHVARLARLELSASEKERMQSELDGILAYIDKLRAQIEGILRAEQKPAYERLLRELGARGAAAAGRVWLPAPGAPRPVELRLGLSDGTSTEVLGGELAEGAEVIVGLVPGAERNGSGLPRMRLF